MNLAIPETRYTRRVDLCVSRRGFVACFSESGTAEVVVIYTLGDRLSRIDR